MEADAQARRWTLVAVCVTTFMLLLDITIVNVALPSIQRRLHAGLTGLEWVVDAYALTLAALILTAGALADRFGRRVALKRMNESRDERAVRADIWGLLTWSAALFLIVFGLLRGNSSGWSSALILGSLIGGGALLVAFVVVERMQERPMLDTDLF